MTTINFDYIGHHPQHIPVIAQWHQDQWHNISPHLSTDKRIQLYSAYPSNAGIPCCIIATERSQPTGSASLVASDMDTHSHLSPWLASVFVHPDFRQQGIATQLINQCIDTARTCQIARIYLFTPDQSAFYQKRGWHHLESCIYHGEQVDIMYYDVTRSSDSNHEPS